MVIYRNVQWKGPDTNEIIFEDIMTQEECAEKFHEPRPGLTCDIEVFWPGMNTPKPEIITSVEVESPIV